MGMKKRLKKMAKRISKMSEEERRQVRQQLGIIEIPTSFGITSYVKHPLFEVPRKDLE